ncbi:MAG TPA: glycosyl hydrolase, partial [Candidatus Synoicihabitans sp.]|nr:glycosyl hydrolase [Candidatus Synoicihabitans sp.]
AGATVLGPKPTHATGLTDRAAADAEVRRLADVLWPRVQAGRSSREVLRELGVPPDFAFTAEGDAAMVNYVHRRTADADIYFVANRSKQPISGVASFRVEGRAPELWDAVAGTRRIATNYASEDGRTNVPIELAASGSQFVVFRRSAAEHPSTGAPNWRTLQPMHTLAGEWEVQFDPEWGGPSRTIFPELIDWTTHADAGIRYYSGTAVYRKTFDAAAGASTLDLGRVRELAHVRLNGRSLGVLWAPPFQVEVAELLQPTGNVLEIEVVNFWANRVIGDEALPLAERRTRTNIRSLKPNTPLMPSGLMGPVQLLRVANE